MARIRDWLKEHIHLPSSKSTGKTRCCVDNPPFLPSHRRPITPSNVTPQLSACAFFTKLPEDIRREILIAAFGDRTIHMNLEFTHPYPVLPPLDDAGGNNTHRHTHHARIAPLRNEHLLHKSDMVWRWDGSVCHRQARDYAPVGQDACFLFHAVWLDGCMAGRNTYCESYGVSLPRDCQIGILGFVLSCKQA